MGSSIGKRGQIQTQSIQSGTFCTMAPSGQSPNTFIKLRFSVYYESGILDSAGLTKFDNLDTVRLSVSRFIRDVFVQPI